MKTALSILGFIILSFLVYLGFYNAYYSPKISIQDEGNEIMVYETIYGHYHLSDSVMKNVFNVLYEKNGIVVTKGFGRYYQNPKEVGEADLTFDAGCIVEDKDSLALAQISHTFKTEKSVQQLYIVSDFPLKGKMSIMFGMFKVYPKLDKYCIENKYDAKLPVVEIYDRVEKKIHYRRKLVQLK